MFSLSVENGSHCASLQSQSLKNGFVSYLSEFLLLESSILGAQLNIHSSTDVAALTSPGIINPQETKFRGHFPRVSRDNATEAHVWRDKSSLANFCSIRPFPEELESWKSV
ncbi:hypothetical protein XENORESO_015525 [Xenotaenia resolanae]|uniref:Uncharacterized protein n=1 Tax=Xenotaenia resolanae TaxID=208358 RepID=A0ABV0WUQ9_9TELE